MTVLIYLIVELSNPCSYLCKEKMFRLYEAAFMRICLIKAVYYISKWASWPHNRTLFYDMSYQLKLGNVPSILVKECLFIYNLYIVATNLVYLDDIFPPSIWWTKVIFSLCFHKSSLWDLKMVTWFTNTLYFCDQYALYERILLHVHFFLFLWN